MDVRKLFLVLAGLAYIGFGFYILFAGILTDFWNVALGILFIVYGSWRLYRSKTSTQYE